jgi:hypothetical protein
MPREVGDIAPNKAFKFVPAFGLHRTQLRCAA